MTLIEYENSFDDILYEFKLGNLTESQLEDEMEALQNDWE